MPEYKTPRLLPPVWLLVSLVLMEVLHWWLPGLRLIPSPWNWIGLAPLLAGLTLAATGAGLFRRRGTGVKPFSPASVLVIEGPYRFTRNPMYLGMVLALLGIALISGTLTPFIVVVLFAVLIHTRFILHEEVFMRERFGEDYDRYRQRVRRWV